MSVGEGSELLREPPSVEDRKPITTPLITGIKAGLACKLDLQ